MLDNKRFENNEKINSAFPFRHVEGPLGSMYENCLPDAYNWMCLALRSAGIVNLAWLPLLAWTNSNFCNSKLTSHISTETNLFSITYKAQLWPGLTSESRPTLQEHCTTAHLYSASTKHLYCQCPGPRHLKINLLQWLFSSFHAYYKILYAQAIISISVHQWVNRPVGSMPSEVLLSLYSNKAQDFHLPVLAEVILWQGISVWYREQIDLTSGSSPSNTRCLSHLAWQTQGCWLLRVSVLSKHGSRKHYPWLGLAEVDRSHWTVCHRPGRGEKDRPEETRACILMVSLQNKQVDGERVG